MLSTGEDVEADALFKRGWEVTMAVNIRHDHRCVRDHQPIAQ